jgi:transposase
MQCTEEKYKRIAHLLPVQRGNVEIDNLLFLQAIQYMTENGCRWRALPQEFGKWFTIYRRFCRWTEQGVFDRIEKELQSQAIEAKYVTLLPLDSIYIKVHPDGMGAIQKK